MSRNPTAQHGLLAAFLALVALAPTVPAHAAGETLITHAKALAGNVTPDDTAGYPVTLSIPGSYALAGNLAVPVGSFGIHITAHDVTVDLTGFRIDGATTANHGIYGTTNGATVENGTIAHFKYHGIYLTGGYAIVEDMRVVGNGGYGVHAGDDAHVRSSAISENGLQGVLCGDLCVVERSTATSNHGDGIYCKLACHAEGNLASNNGRFGIALFDGFVLGNTISRNNSFGIAGGGSSATVYGNNTLTGNNQGNAQAQYVSSLHANYCYPGACP